MLQAESPSACRDQGRAGVTLREPHPIDMAAMPVFAASFGAIARQPCVLDVSRLDFIDLVEMRTIAGIAIWAKTSITLRGLRPALRRYWNLAGFDELPPGVQLAA